MQPKLVTEPHHELRHIRVCISDVLLVVLSVW
jgi:hypothetical protein